MTKNILQILIISFLVGGINFLINPNRPILGLLADELTVEKVLSITDKILIVDARSQKEFESGNIKGSINLSEEKFNSQIGEFLEQWTPDIIIIVYCNSKSCNSSRKVADRLTKEYEIKNVYVLKDDWKKWKR